MNDDIMFKRVDEKFWRIKLNRKLEIFVKLDG